MRFCFVMRRAAPPVFTRYDYLQDPAVDLSKGQPLTAQEALARRTEFDNFDYATLFQRPSSEPPAKRQTTSRPGRSVKDPQGFKAPVSQYESRHYSGWEIQAISDQAYHKGRADAGAEIASQHLNAAMRQVYQLGASQRPSEHGQGHTGWSAPGRDSSAPASQRNTRDRGGESRAER